MSTHEELNFNSAFCLFPERLTDTNGELDALIDEESAISGARGVENPLFVVDLLVKACAFQGVSSATFQRPRWLRCTLTLGGLDGKSFPVVLSCAGDGCALLRGHMVVRCHAAMDHVNEAVH